MKPLEFGDFQTPAPLAEQVLQVVCRQGFSPAAVLEPTVGTGQLLAAALRACPSCSRAHGIDIDPHHLRLARERVRGARARVSLLHADIFALDLDAVVAALPSPLLIVGNPPWVTSSRQGSVGAANLPAKTNFERQRGIDAITGRSNFDISEWIILRLLHALAGRQGVLAMLCKTKVARRVLLHCARHSVGLEDAAIFAIDAAAHFGAAVDACLFVCRAGASQGELACDWYGRLDAMSPEHQVRFVHGVEVADARAFQRASAYFRQGSTRWRSGIKHDCARVMELETRPAGLFNGAGERVDLEPDYLYPLLKGTDLVHGRVPGSRYLLVPQRSTGDDPAAIRTRAPRTWEYLVQHRRALARRASSIFASRPEFCVFGVGDYTFTPWKLAVPALARSLVLRVVGPQRGRPVVFDDTCYLLACDNELHARVIHALLQLPAARALMESLIFWRDKRPIRADRLGSVDLARLAARHRSPVLEALSATRFSRLRVQQQLDRIARG